MLRGGHRDFPLVLFGLSVLENFVGNPFNLPETFGFRNMHENGKSRSSVEKFCLTIREKFPGTTANFQNFWDIGNFHAHHGFPSMFFCLTVPKNFVRNLLMFQKVSNFRYRKNLCIRTEYHGFSSKIFHLRGPKDLVVELFGKSEKFDYRRI